MRARKAAFPAKRPVLDCLFGYRKRARALVYLIVHKGEVTQTLNLEGAGGRVTAASVAFSSPVEPPFFLSPPSSESLAALPWLGRNHIDQQEGGGTD